MQTERKIAQQASNLNTANGIPKNGCQKGRITAKLIDERTAPKKSNWNTFLSSKSLNIRIE